MYINYGMSFTCTLNKITDFLFSALSFTVSPFLLWLIWAKQTHHF